MIRMTRDIAGAALLAVELDRSREDAENERIPQEEERIKLTNRCFAHHGNPRQNKRKRGENPHRLPQPAFNKVFAHHMSTIE